MTNLVTCIICNSKYTDNKSQNPKQFIEVFETYCRHLKIKLKGSMQWNFFEEGLPFCDFCVATVEKIWDLNNQLNSIQVAINNILRKTKVDILKSKSTNWRKGLPEKAEQENSFKRVWNFRRQAVREFDPDVRLCRRNIFKGRQIRQPKSTVKSKVVNHRSQEPEPRSQNINSVESNIITEDVDNQYKLFPAQLELEKADICIPEPSSTRTAGSSVNDCEDPLFQVVEPLFQKENTLQTVNVNNETKQGENTCIQISNCSSNTFDASNEDQNYSGAINTTNCTEMEDEYEIEIPNEERSIDPLELYGDKDQCSSSCTYEESSEESNIISEIITPKLANPLNGINPPDKTDRVKCHLCSLTFNKMSNARRHIYSVHKICNEKKKSVYPCPFCPFIFYLQNSYNRHVQIHKEGRDYICREQNCNRRFMTLAKLQAHKKIPHKFKNFTCNDCEMGFRYPHQLKTHIECRHPQDTTLRTDEQVLGFESELEGTEMMNEDVDGYIDSPTVSNTEDVDSDLNESQTIKEELNIESEHNSMTHSLSIPTSDDNEANSSVTTFKGISIIQFGENYYQCGNCGYSLKGRKGIHQHIWSTHFDSTAVFKCKVCSMPFGRNSRRNDHERRHRNGNINNNECKICGVCCMNTWTLDQHVYEIHNEDDPNLMFPCPICGIEFPNRKVCQSHGRSHVFQQRFKCSKKLCKKTFPSILDVENHQLTCIARV